MGRINWHSNEHDTRIHEYCLFVMSYFFMLEAEKMFSWQGCRICIMFSKDASKTVIHYSGVRSIINIISWSISPWDLCMRRNKTLLFKILKKSWRHIEKWCQLPWIHECTWQRITWYQQHSTEACKWHFGGNSVRNSIRNNVRRNLQSMTSEVIT